MCGRAVVMSNAFQHNIDKCFFLSVMTKNGVMCVGEWFRKVSGLAVNKDKTKVMNIGAIW